MYVIETLMRKFGRTWNSVELNFSFSQMSTIVSIGNCMGTQKTVFYFLI